MDAHNFQETPQARVEWHLACIEARRSGVPLPKAPWESVEERTEPAPQKSREGRTQVSPLAELKLPKRSQAVTSQSVRASSVNKVKVSESSARGDGKPKIPAETRDERVSSRQTFRVPPRQTAEVPPRQVPAPRLQPGAEPACAVVVKPQQPNPVWDIPLRRDKEVVIDALLLGAGVPMESLTTEGRTGTVFSNYILLRQAVWYQVKLGAQYDIGKQFQLNGSVAEALKIADVVIKVLDAPSKVILMAAKIEAQTLLTGVVQSRNLLFLKHRV